MRPAGKARRARIPGVFERGATQPDPGPPTRQPRWGGGGMQRRPNAAGVSPRAVKVERRQDLVKSTRVVLRAVTLHRARVAIGFRRRIRVLRHPVERQWLNHVRTGRIHVHLLAETVRVQKERPRQSDLADPTPPTPPPPPPPTPPPSPPSPARPFSRPAYPVCGGGPNSTAG